MEAFKTEVALDIKKVGREKVFGKHFLSEGHVHVHVAPEPIFWGVVRFLLTP